MSSCYKRKKVLYIENNSNPQNFKFLENYFDITTQQFNSLTLVNKNIGYIIELIDNFDIIILGGGPQHLTTEQIHNYPEIDNQIEIVKYIKNKTNGTKLLIGICLGCQIIGLALGHKVIQMEKLCFGYDFLDTKSINYDYIKKSNDLYLSKLDYELLAKSFCFHYDQINIKQPDLIENNSEIIVIGQSKTNVPYIIKHSKSNIYGFQFHPELTIDSVKNAKNYLTSNNLCNSDNLNNPMDNLVKNYNTSVLFHFFTVFFSK